MTEISTDHVDHQLARIRREFRTRLQAHRKAMGPRKTLVAKTGISMNTLTSYEEGRTTPDIDNLVRLALALNVTPAYLLGEGELQLRSSANESQPTS
jgi:transcriptional regulator with XRE-family HTH domain